MGYEDESKSFRGGGDRIWDKLLKFGKRVRGFVKRGGI